MSPATFNFYEQLTASRYGAMEMKQLIGPNLLKGLLISFLIHFTVITAPLLLKVLQGDEAVPTQLVVYKSTELQLLVRQNNETQQQIQIAQPKLDALTAVIPISTPNEVIGEEPLIKKQSELIIGLSVEPGSEGVSGLKPNEIVDITQEGLGSDEDPPPSKFVAVEYSPQPLENFSPLPAYPKLAETSGVKGYVVVLCLVDKTGAVKKFQFKSVQPENLGFSEEVAKVITGWKFTPAIQNGKPVSVWVEIPFSFGSEK